MSIYTQLVEREQNKNPIRVGVIGAGQMGFGMIAQIASIPGMVVAGISDINMDNALKAKKAFDEKASLPYEVFLSTSFKEVVNHPNVEVLVDATGVPEVGAKLAMECLMAKKHLVLLNVEIDITVGPLLHKLFSAANLMYTGSDGDEPASTFELYEFAKTMGFEVLVLGKGKNNKLRPEANPDSVGQEAKDRNMSAHMLASFADGTKTMAEMTLLSNATGFVADVRGMHGTAGHLNETVAQLRLKSDGGVLDKYGVVEYVDGLAPGVFAIIKAQSVGVADTMNYMMKVDRDHHILYRPFHLASLETPVTIARALLNRQAAITPIRQVSDTIAVSKKEIKAGERLDGIGGYCVRGVIESHEVTKENGLIPIGLIAGNCVAKRDIPNGTAITHDDVAIDTTTTVWKLRQLQEELLG